jgi:hypothetical protein
MLQQNPVVPEGWSIQVIKFHHDFAYWGMWALNFLSSLMPGVSPTPPAADVSYTLCRRADGAVQTLRLPGDHAPDALAKAMLLIEARRGNQSHSNN